MKPDRRDRRERIAALLIAALVAVLAFAVLGPRVFSSRTSAPPSLRAGAGAPPVDAGVEPRSTDIVPVDRVTVPITATLGGPVRAPGGAAQLEIPPQSLWTDTTVEVERVRLDHPGALDAFAVNLLPDGLQLRAPATLSLSLPVGVQPSEVEIVAYDPRLRQWVAETNPIASTDPDAVAAHITHFSLRRIRIRPGMVAPQDPAVGRGAFRLESDPGNAFERLVDAHWEAVGARSRTSRDLVEMGRVKRHGLIAEGRLRAVTGSAAARTPLRDNDRRAMLPQDSPARASGTVRLTRLDESGRPTPFVVDAAVDPEPIRPALVAAGVTVVLTRAAMEALGFRYGIDFGVDPAAPDRAFLHVPAGTPGQVLRYVPLRVEPAPVASRG